LEIAKIVFHLGIEFVKNAVSSMKDDADPAERDPSGHERL